MSSVAVVFALSRWLGQVWLGRLLVREKAKYSRELEQLKATYAQELQQSRDALDRSQTLLRAEIDRSVFVTRAQFETEFGAYKQVFEGLAEMRLSMAAMRPMLGPGESTEDRQRRLADRFQDLTNAYNKAVSVIENLSPFYPKNIYNELLECLRAAHLEMLQVQTGGSETFSPKWYSQGEQQMAKFTMAYNAVSDMIRDRIAVLAILPRG